MNAHNNYTQQKHDELVVNHSVRSCVALILFCMHKFWRCKPETCRKRFNDIKQLFDTREIMGQKINDYDAIDFCKKQLGIDVNEIKVKVKFK